MKRVGSVFRDTALLLAWAALVPLYAILLFPGSRLGAGHGTAVEAARLGVDAASATISPADTVTIALTAATLVLGAVAFIISLLAFIGYAALKDITEKAAAVEAARVAGEIAAKVANERFDAAEGARQEEMLQAKGLRSGEEADQIANAIGAPPPNPEQLGEKEI